MSLATFHVAVHHCYAQAICLEAMREAWRIQKGSSKRSADSREVTREAWLR
jgi:hypothetical protein